jgi:hypothetical protein
MGTHPAAPACSVRAGLQSPGYGDRPQGNLGALSAPRGARAGGQTPHPAVRRGGPGPPDRGEVGGSENTAPPPSPALTRADEDSHGTYPCPWPSPKPVTGVPDSAFPTPTARKSHHPASLPADASMPSPAELRGFLPNPPADRGPFEPMAARARPRPRFSQPIRSSEEFPCAQVPARMM